jgi:RHS repeat-associated protein
MCVTDAAGAVRERHRYGVFGAGAAFAADGVTPLASLRTEAMWRGMPALGTTTLFRTPKRLYDPEIGVFTSRDPLLYADSPSPYVYAAHNPVDFADPTGLAKSPLGEAPEVRTGISKWLYEDSRRGVWRMAPRKGDWFEESGPVDTGSTLGNYAFNSWISLSNMVKSAINTPLEMLNDLDDAMSSSRFGVEWQGPIRHMMPLMRGMGLGIETAGTLTYARGLLSSMGPWISSAAQSMALSSTTIGGFSGVPLLRSATKPGVKYQFVGETPVISDAAWARAQISLTGSRTEYVFNRISSRGKVRQILIDAIDGPAIEAKYGNMGQMWNPQRYEHIIRQSHDYIDISRTFGLPGVQYRVSTELGAVRLLSAFTLEHAEHLRSGFLVVRWYTIP